MNWVHPFLSTLQPYVSTLQCDALIRKTRGEKPYHEHCPLCVDSIVRPKQDKRTPAIIFLSMDGVMIGDRMSPVFRDKILSTLSTLFFQVENFNDYHWTVAKGRHLDPGALFNLHTLIERIEYSGRRALVVLTSGWRNDATLQQHREQVFRQHQFCKYLCGKTAPQYDDTQWTPECRQGFEFTRAAKHKFNLDLNNKGDVIEYWLRNHGFDLHSTNFVVINRHSIQKFRNRLIQTDGLLFQTKHLQQAIDLLRV